ncbi:MAG: carbamoyltransferase HypF [Chloroflexota bacterium]|nr:carbamoyltransferase HypF [Chloroflexota bacterium]
MSATSRHIHINGIVQGVGFRPFVYNLAMQHNLSGWVCNSASGVDIEVTGAPQEMAAFIEALPDEAPSLAQIDSIDTEKIPIETFNGFEIVPSQDSAADFIPVSPDVAICEQCKSELFDSADRRFRYPFINCTNCGPRFTIIKDIPYDRPLTTMAGFEMCPACREEYENPADRRFHAQPIACPICGPQVWLEDVDGNKLVEREEAIQQARTQLAEGKILAIKGLGGFHLACDASNESAVAALRQRKHRPGKPFALMASGLEAIQRYVTVDPAAKELLTSPQAPIVLMPRVPDADLAENIAPGQNRLGFMLPYTPLHLLLLEPAPGYPQALVMTSGNRSEEPIIRENAAARERLAGIADAFLLHDRPIHMRIDDSVYTTVQNKPYPVRRARGYAPNPIRLEKTLPKVLAVGPQMKNTFCLTRDRYAFLSHYIGEMENWETLQDYEAAILHYETLFRIHPEVIGYDLHPDYASTRYALDRADRDDLPAIAIQHHHAHLAAGLVENKLPPDQTVAGLIFDGTGYGTDDTIWGGEALLGSCAGFSRPFCLQPIPLPGGEASIRKPARIALSLLWAYDLPWDERLNPVRALPPLEREALQHQLESGINTPLSSSMGRLFDAVSALLGVREAISYEAQAAIELEAVADPDELGYYPWQIDGDKINLRLMLDALLVDLANKEAPPLIAARFHNTLARLSLDLAKRIREQFNIRQIVLSGGVWQNLRLLETTIELLQDNGFTPLIHRQLPPNDGCVAFGQAMIAAYWYTHQKE